MILIPGKYQHYKNENIEDCFIAFGVPYFSRKVMALSSPLMEISLDGDIMTIKSSSLIRLAENKFKLGDEYEENMASAIMKCITTIINENEMITNSVFLKTGDKCARHYHFTDDECVITLTHDKAKTPGRRYFRRVK